MDIFILYLVFVVLSMILAMVAELIYSDKDHEIAIIGSFLGPLMFVITMAMVMQASWRRIVWCYRKIR